MRRVRRRTDGVSLLAIPSRERPRIEHSRRDEAGVVHVGGEHPARRGAGGLDLDEEVAEPVARQPKSAPLRDEPLDVAYDVMLGERGGRDGAQLLQDLHGKQNAE